MKNVSTQYKELKEGKLSKGQFLSNVKRMFPQYLSPMNSLQDTVTILKNKGLLSEVEEKKKTPKNQIYGKKYKRVINEPEDSEQKGIYPATTLTDIPKPEWEWEAPKECKSDGLIDLKDKDEKNKMKKVKISLNESLNITGMNGMYNMLKDPKHMSEGRKMLTEILNSIHLDGDSYISEGMSKEEFYNYKTVVETLSKRFLNELVAVENPSGYIVRYFDNEEEAHEWIEDMDPDGMYDYSVRDTED